jgi:hypothetical protein
MGKALRFCVGQPADLRSTVWKIWTHRNDVYLSSRAIASYMKVSLHESGACQFSETSESFAQKGKRNCERHKEQWQRRRAYAESGVVHLFRVIIPQSELRLSSVEKKPAKNVIWYPSPPPGHGAYVELWLTPKLDEPPTESQFMHHLLGVLQLSNGQYVGVTVRYLEISCQDNEQLGDLRNRGKELEQRSDSRLRGWALMLSSQGLYALVEFAPYPDEVGEQHEGLWRRLCRGLRLIKASRGW